MCFFMLLALAQNRGLWPSNGCASIGSQTFTGRLVKDGLSLQNFGTDALEFAVLFQPILFAANGVLVIVFVDDACDDEQAAIGFECDVFVAPAFKSFFGWAITD